MLCALPLLHDAVGCDCPELEPAEALDEWVATTPIAEQSAHVDAALARRSLAEFFRQAFAEVIEPAVFYEHGKHIDAICDHIQWQLEERAHAILDRSYEMQCPDLLINMPPRALKTIIVQVAAVAWAWLQWPHLRILCLSTNPRVSTEAADKCRALIQSEWYQTAFAPEWQVRDDKDGVTALGTTAGGLRSARGWDSNVVGDGADWRILDDPDDPDDVLSDIIRAGVERRWQNSIANRKTDPRTSITTGIQQRVHIDDWSSHRIAEGWIRLVLRQEFSTKAERAATPMPVGNDNRLAKAPTGRTWCDWRTVNGETLHPRFTSAWCAKERKRLGPLGYEAQHNQEPRLTDGNFFKRADWRFFRFHDDAPVEASRRPEGCDRGAALTIKRNAFEWICTTTDAAFTKSDTSDPVGVLVIAGIGSRIFVLADLTMRRDYPETRDLIKALAVTYPWASHLIEKKANGDAVLSELGSVVGGLIGLTPEGGKPSRANACTPRVAAGDVYLLDGAEWLAEFVAELADFPGGAHDDRVDAFTQALIHFGANPSVAAFFALAQA
jgi:predicted phage terminase large subunit-like protein